MSDAPLFDGPMSWKGSHPRVLVYGPEVDGLLDVVVTLPAYRNPRGFVLPDTVLFLGVFRPSDRFVSVPWAVRGDHVFWSKDNVLDAIVARALKGFEYHG